MRLRQVLMCLALGAGVSACVGIPAELGASNSASLVFLNEADAAHFPGWFSAIDNGQISGTPAAIRVPAGVHTISYSCPGTITMDRHPTVRGDFRAGTAYALECRTTQPARILER